MDKKPLINKYLTVGIILLFVGIAVNPTTGLLNNRDDTTPPMTTATMDPEFHIGWYPLGVMVELNATDNESGVNITYYRIDSGGWITYTHPFRIEDDGVFVVQFYSVDNAGNHEVPKQVEIKIDNDPPVIEVSLDPPAPNGNNGWYISGVLVTLNVTDDESGVWRTYINGMIYTSPYYWSGGLLVILSIDNVGNAESLTLGPLKIDTEPPSITMDYTWEGNPWHGYTFIFTATCNDAMSGMEKVEFYFMGVLQETVMGAGPEYVWSYKQGPITQRIKAIAYDNAGWTNSTEIVDPHSAQTHCQGIHKCILLHQIMNLFISKLKRGNR